jgi:general secretion pathway protein A
MNKNKRWFAQWGLKWNPFAEDIPTEALHVTERLERFCWRAENLARDGGFAVVSGDAGTGKSAALRMLTTRLDNLRDLKVGVITRPQAGLPDFYRELGDLFGVQLRPNNRWNATKMLRERWQAHLDAALYRPVVIIDEAQEMQPAVLNELRLMSSTKLDSHMLLTVALGGDSRLLEKLRAAELLPLASRIRLTLLLERLSPAELEEFLRHALVQAGAPKLMTSELISALCEHAAGNLRALMIMGNELLARGAESETPQLDEKLYFETFSTPVASSPKRGDSSSKRRR